MLSTLAVSSLLLSLSLAGEVITGPSSPSQWGSWINGLKSQRASALKSIDYNGSICEVPELEWIQSSFIQPQMHGYDQFFYDYDTHAYTYDKFLNDLTTRYGGIDSYLFWVTYTNIGADDRNQFDLNYALPGGVKALQAMSEFMHAHNGGGKNGIRILYPYNPWDTGTHYSGHPDYITMANFLNEVGGDGFNGDTMGWVSEDFYTYSVNTFQHPIAIEPEGGGDLQSMNWDQMGWGYWSPYKSKPWLGQWKWYESRRLTNVCDRWAQNHTGDIQNAYFNGGGFESWENVWGCWNGIVPRDGEAVRRTATILRYFGNRYTTSSKFKFIQSEDFLPFIPIVAQSQYYRNIFASGFQLASGTATQQIVFLMVNSLSDDIERAQIAFDNSFTISASSINVYDCYHGSALTPSIANGVITVEVSMEGLGYGCVFATYDSRAANAGLDTFLTAMASMTAKPLSSYSTRWRYLTQTMKAIPATTAYAKAPTANMQEVPYGLFFYSNSGVEIEGNDETGVDVQFAWEMHPQREHNTWMTMARIFVDKYPVTCAQYKAYLTASAYVPREDYNFLKNWHNSGNGSYDFPNGYANKPVTYVSINEARLYCAAAGKRLPHAYEWQYAAQGNTGYAYPWGNTAHQGTNYPNPSNGRTLPGPADVDAFASVGSSMYGVSDLIGNVWQYTDEFADIHTRAAIVRGSANYRPSGSMWYFPTAYKLSQHNKYFLMDDTYERCGTIGFRCVADATRPTTNGGAPLYWRGSGSYCYDGAAMNGELMCAALNPCPGLSDLTAVGALDWVSFGYDTRAGGFMEVRKQTSTGSYIGNLTASGGVSPYSNNPNGYYWSDGTPSAYSVVTADDPDVSGIYISGNSGGFQFAVNRLRGGNKYLLRVFVGAYAKRGQLSVKLSVDGKAAGSFVDSTNSAPSGTTSNVMYTVVLDLSTVATSSAVELICQWLNTSDGSGNVTLQSIALQLLNAVKKQQQK